jgi:cation:H+ antiporter
MLAVVGSTAAISAEGVAVAPAVLNFDLPVLVAVTVACLPIFFTGGRIARWEGALFLAYYVAYVAFLVFAATKHEALQPFSMIMAWFAIPLTVLGLLISVAVYLRIPRDKRVIPPQ